MTKNTENHDLVHNLGHSLDHNHYDIAIIGGGLAGRLASLALAQHHFHIAHIAPYPKHDDLRTTALLDPSVEFIKSLGIWEDMAPLATPLRQLRIVDATERLFRAPETLFHATELKLEAFGYNVHNQDLLNIFEEKANALQNYNYIDDTMQGLSMHKQGVDIYLNHDQVLHATLLIGADGARSHVRDHLDITSKTQDFGQIALVTILSHQQSHGLTSTEFHTKEGPCTFVPLANKTSSLVWVMNEQRAQRLLECSEDDFVSELSDTCHHYLGKMKMETPRQSFPIKSLRLNRYTDRNAILVGDAAHAIPPIGAQGFNLGIADIKIITEMLVENTNLSNKENISQAATELTQSYSNKRASQIQTTTMAVDLLNRSLLSDFLPLQILLSSGLYAASKIKPLRLALMKAGLR